MTGPDRSYLSLRQLVDYRADLQDRIRDGSTDPDDFVELLATEERIRQHVIDARSMNVRSALENGATWEAIAVATNCDVETARGRFSTWVKRQAHLYDQTGDFGLSPDQRRSTRALLDKS